MKTIKVYPFSYWMIIKRDDQLLIFQRYWNNLMALEHFIVEGLLMLIVNSCGVLLNIIRYWFRTLWKLWQSVWYWTLRMIARKSGYYHGHGYFFKWNKKSTKESIFILTMHHLLEIPLWFNRCNDKFQHTLTIMWFTGCQAPNNFYLIQHMAA